LLIAQDMDEFKRAIERLINDHELYKTISANASFFVKQQYSWSHANRIILEKCLNYSVA
jgi:glycosyltransferase involved in cell wall biosynthesis